MLSLSRVESRREGAREQDREGVKVSNRGVKLSQSVRSVRQASRQRGSVFGAKGCESKQVALPLQGLITRGCTPYWSNLPDLLGDPSPTDLFWERQTGLFIGLTPFIQKESVCGWLQWGRRGVSRMGWGSSRTQRGGEGRRERKEAERRGILRYLAHVLPLTALLTFKNSPSALAFMKRVKLPVRMGIKHPWVFNPRVSHNNSPSLAL